MLLRKSSSTSKQEAIYTPDRRQKMGLFSTWALMFSHMIAKRELIWQLFVRDFFMANRRSFLGSMWLFLSPVFGMVSWLFLNLTGLLSPGDVGIPYPIYLLNGTLIWMLFLNTFTQTKDTLFITQTYITQVSFPHEVIVIKQIMQAVATMFFGLIINIPVMIAFGVWPSPLILLLPLLLLPLIFISASIGLMTAVVKVVIPDIEKVLIQVFPLIMYTIPVVYSSTPANETLATVIKYNPLTYALTLPRDIMVGITDLPWKEYSLCALGAALLFLVTLRIFFITEEIIIERIY